MKLFSSCNLGPIELRNRVVMSPMTRCRAIGNLPNALMAEYYGQRASAGMIITEGTSPSPNGLGYARIPGIYSAEQTKAGKQVTDAVHVKGGRIFIQLMHVGRVGSSVNLPARTTNGKSNPARPDSRTCRCTIRRSSGSATSTTFSARTWPRPKPPTCCSGNG